MAQEDLLGWPDEEASMRLHTTVLQADKTATGIIVPDEVVESLAPGSDRP